MDQSEAVELLAATDHAAYVLERAEAAVEACDVKIERAEAHLVAANEAVEAAVSASASAREDYNRARDAAAEIPDELRAFVAEHHPNIVSAQAQTADATGGAS